MVRWITDTLGTASYYDYQAEGNSAEATLIDVRDMLDKEGNSQQRLTTHIQEAYNALQAGKRVVICCDRGISRSNAVALGVLLASGMAFEEALPRLVEKVDVADINLGLLHNIRSLFQLAVPPSQMDSNILVTGASGFVGRTLVKTLKSTYNIFSPNQTELDLIHNPGFLDAYINGNRINFIIHLAHPKTRNSVSTMGETVAMTRNILEVCRLNGVGILYLSCLAVFSGYTHSLKANSLSKPFPKGVYAETKFLCEALVKIYQQSYELNGIILRPSLLYGVQMDKALFISKFFEAANQGRTVYTHRYRNGLPSFDFLYLDDLIEAIRLAINLKPKAALSIGTGRATSTYELAQLIVKTCQSRSEVKTIDIEESAYHVVADPAEALERLGWSPKVDLERGLQKLWQHDYKDHYLR